MKRFISIFKDSANELTVICVVLFIKLFADKIS